MTESEKHSGWSTSTVWTMRKARKVYASSHDTRLRFRAWWRGFCTPKMTVHSEKLRYIAAAAFQMPASAARKRAGL